MFFFSQNQGTFSFKTPKFLYGFSAFRFRCRWSFSSRCMSFFSLLLQSFSRFFSSPYVIFLFILLLYFYVVLMPFSLFGLRFLFYLLFLVDVDPKCEWFKIKQLRNVKIESTHSKVKRTKKNFCLVFLFLVCFVLGYSACIFITFLVWLFDDELVSTHRSMQCIGIKK